MDSTCCARVRVTPVRFTICCESITSWGFIEPLISVPTSTEPGTFTPANEDEELRQGEEVIGAIKHEAGAMNLIAEDLGTVPPWVRASLTRLGVPGYKVMQWERDWGQRRRTVSQSRDLSRTFAGDDRDA